MTLTPLSPSDCFNVTVASGHEVRCTHMACDVKIQLSGWRTLADAHGNTLATQPTTFRDRLDVYLLPFGRQFDIVLGRPLRQGAISSIADAEYECASSCT